jgi:hypothetical protein
MLSRKSYRQVLAGLSKLREQHEEDRCENPGFIPPAWCSAIRPLIERTVRTNHEPCPKGTADETIAYLVKQGILVDYLGDVTFPSDERLPTRIEIVAKTKAYVERIG